MVSKSTKKRTELRIIKRHHINEFMGVLMAWTQLISLHSRKKSISRTRRSFAAVVATLSEDEFKQMFRVSKEAFNILVLRFSPFLTGPLEEKPVELCDNCQLEHCDGVQVIPNRAISVRTKVAIFLRMMAGGSYLDLALLFGIADCTVYKVFNDCLQAAEQVLEWACLPDKTDIDEYKYRALCFAWSRKRLNPLPGCVGAVDGIHVRIEQPSKKHGPRQFYSRKGFFSIPVQAMVDHKYRFIACSAICKGSTQDSVALRLSIIGRFLSDDGLPEGFYASGDDAYAGFCPEQLLTPFRRALASKYELSFNFFHSSHRVHVEQAFGILMRRWGILWRPLRFKLETVSLIVSVAMLLHNFCIDRDGGVVKRNPKPEERREAYLELEKWLDWCTGRTEEHGDSIFGMADDSVPDTENMHLIHKSRTRAYLVQLLRMKSKLDPEYTRTSWLDIAAEAPEHFHDSDSDTDDSSGGSNAHPNKSNSSYDGIHSGSDDDDEIRSGAMEDIS